MSIIRVFPRRTAYTPTDDLAFVGDPPLLRPAAAEEVHISVTFSWDMARAERLAAAWQQYYPIVRVGGPAYKAPLAEPFEPGMYVKRGVTFTSRGCTQVCPWCLVPEREGRLWHCGDIAEGHIIQDNNFLACLPAHRRRVYAMLKTQPKAAIFAGGLQASLVTDEVARELREVRIDNVFLAADTAALLGPLSRAAQKLSFLARRRLRCYMLLGYGGDTLRDAGERLEAAWEIGVLPFAQLYQPSDRWINYSPEWRALARQWSRPAAMFASHREGQS